MLNRFNKGFQDYWSSRNLVSTALSPVSWLFRSVVRLRRGYYGLRNRQRPRLPVPVIVVGNLSVGGTGKTPLVIWLVKALAASGYRPGVITRGYGGKAKLWPQCVTAGSDPRLVGDEPVLIAARGGCPVAAGPDRVRGARILLEKFGCDVIVSDDGLQHYNLMRDIEIAVIDGVRRFGNGRCLPAGPLREPVQRLKEVDFIIANGNAEPGEYSMTVRGETAVNLLSPREVRPLANFRGDHVHAVAGTGNPDRFFDLLKTCGLRVDTHPFPDHHSYSPADLEFGDGRPVLMTEKDAIKCRTFVRENHWSVPVNAFPDDRFAKRLLERLRSYSSGQKTARDSRMPRNQGAADLR